MIGLALNPGVLAEAGIGTFRTCPTSPMMPGHCDREDMIWDTQPSSSQTHPLIGSRAAMSKMLADCEVLYIPVFLARAKMAKASYFEGGIRCSRQSNGTPDTTLANG
jgi:hypothetical protein